MEVSHLSPLIHHYYTVKSIFYIKNIRFNHCFKANYCVFRYLEIWLYHDLNENQA